MSQQRSVIRLIWKMALVMITVATLSISFGEAFAQGEGNMQVLTVDGGGGSATGGAFSLVATIAQPDAGKLSGGSFILFGGFWMPLSLDPAGTPDDKFLITLPFVASE